MGTRQIYLKNELDRLVVKEMENKNLRISEVIELALKKYFGVK